MSLDYTQDTTIFGTLSTANDLEFPDTFTPSHSLDAAYSGLSPHMFDCSIPAESSFWTNTADTLTDTDDTLPPTAAPAAGDHHLSTPHPSLGGGMVSLIAGARIDTLMGEMPVEALGPDDLIVTRDHGLQTVHWVGQTTMEVSPEDAPIAIAKDTFGNDRDLLISPQQAILLEDERAEMFLGKGKALVRAVDLLNHAGVTRADVKTVTYVHVLIDEGQMIRADGVWSECHYPDDETLFAEDDSFQKEPVQFIPVSAFDTRFDTYDVSMQAA